MKKYISTVIAVILALSVVLLIWSDENKKTVKFGMGIVSSYGECKNASSEADGQGEAVVNIAAVLVDDNGKIVKCVLDCADNKVQFTSEGTAVEAGEFKTKYELGDNYNMVAYGGAKLEWYQQADAFCGVVEGKTIEQVKALIAEDYTVSDEVINAGCTIYAGDFIKAIEQAVANAKDSKATDDSTLKLGVVTSQSNTDATADANGKIEVSTTIVAAALDVNNNVVAASTDVAAVNIEFDKKGACTTDTTAEIATKYQMGDNYNMVAYGGAKLEWYQQADAFSNTLIGKNSTAIEALIADDGKGVEEVQTAGCTIYVSDLVKAAVKAAAI